MSTETKSPSRAYRKRIRAEREAETRRRITEAAVKLHGSVGPARTTVSAVAREAGVQRGTVYRHFPTEDKLFEACTSHYFSQHPLPDPSAWAEIADPEERLRVALGDVYAFYQDTEQMLATTLRDAELVPAMREAAAAYAALYDVFTKVLLRGRRERGRRRALVAAAIGHALAFETWRSLAREQGLGDDEVVELMLALVAAAG